jgi:hypothetical protein
MVGVIESALEALPSRYAQALALVADASRSYP